MDSFVTARYCDPCSSADSTWEVVASGRLLFDVDADADRAPKLPLPTVQYDHP